MDPDDVIRDFERLTLVDPTELEVDDAIPGVAVLLADPAIAGKERALLTQVGAMATITMMAPTQQARTTN